MNKFVIKIKIGSTLRITCKYPEYYMKLLISGWVLKIVVWWFRFSNTKAHDNNIGSFRCAVPVFACSWCTNKYYYNDLLKIHGTDRSLIIILF